jgi:hypothetical protein
MVSTTSWGKDIWLGEERKEGTYNTQQQRTPTIYVARNWSFVCMVIGRSSE